LFNNVLIFFAVKFIFSSYKLSTKSQRHEITKAVAACKRSEWRKKFFYSRLLVSAAVDKKFYVWWSRRSSHYDFLSETLFELCVENILSHFPGILLLFFIYLNGIEFFIHSTDVQFLMHLMMNQWVTSSTFRHTGDVSIDRGIDQKSSVTLKTSIRQHQHERRILCKLLERKREVKKEIGRLLRNAS
jgi:hypothetical protein